MFYDSPNFPDPQHEGIGATLITAALVLGGLAIYSATRKKTPSPPPLQRVQGHLFGYLGQQRCPPGFYSETKCVPIQRRQAILPKQPQTTVAPRSPWEEGFFQDKTKIFGCVFRDDVLSAFGTAHGMQVNWQRYAKTPDFSVKFKNVWSILNDGSIWDHRGAQPINVSNSVEKLYCTFLKNYQAPTRHE